MKEEKKKCGLASGSEVEVEIEEGGVLKKQRVEYEGGGGVGSVWKPVKCGCKGGCSTKKCSCVKMGRKCGSACKNCTGCKNRL